MDKWMAFDFMKTYGLKSGALMLSKSQVKYIHSFAQKKFRDDEKAFVAEGPKITGEYLRERPESVIGVYAVEGWLEENRPLLRSSGMVIHPLGESELERISFLSTPNQVLAVIRKPESAGPPDLSSGLSLLLDDIQDPGNLGTIVRTADWFGIRNIVCSPATADLYNPKVVQSTMASLLRVNTWYMDLDECIASNKDVPLWAAALDGDDLHNVKQVDLAMLLIGNESKGIRPALLQKTQKRIAIPRYGGAESLNAAVATGIILAHLRRPLNNK